MCRMKAHLRWDDRLDAIPPLAGAFSCLDQHVHRADARGAVAPSPAIPEESVRAYTAE